MSSARIVVSAITRARPRMFSSLLRSLEQMHTPDGVDLVFCFVENDDALSIGEMVDSFSKATGCQAIALTEARRGIPFARNAALDWALHNDADFLAFIDDDERATPDWITNLYQNIENRQLDLTGGPVVPVAPKGKIGGREALVLKGMTLRADRIARRNASLAGQHKDQKVSIVTNNWLCRLDFLRERRLRFDEELGFSGGSDTAFFRMARRAGARTGWAPDAVVEEEIPLSRLTFRYQFIRGRDQAISSYRIRNLDGPSVKTVLKSAFFVISKVLLGLVRLLLSLFDGGRSIVLAMRAFGFAWGRLLAVAGHKSRHYQVVHGT